MKTLKFGRKKAHREHMLRNLAGSLILTEKAETTEAKAKQIKRLIDKSITIAKKGSVDSQRQLRAVYFNSKIVDKLIKILVPRYIDRSSGYTTIVRIGSRVGDNAPHVQISLIGEKPPIESIKTRDSRVTEPTKETDNA